MNTITLKKLLRRQEGPNLEFKREWYELENPRKAASARGEMIKDILSLANGNTNVAGEESYLVIGASNELDENGNRQVFDVVSSKPITRQRILDIVNQYCDPSIEDLLCEEILVDGVRMLVITIPASPHVHNTTQNLKTARITYDKYTVFVRHGEGVRTASTKEYLSLQEIKKLKFKETKNVHPVSFGAVTGAILMGLMGPKLVTKEGDSLQKIRAAQIIGVFIGATLGGLIGWNYAEIKTLPLAFKRATPRDNMIGLMAATGYGLINWWFLRYSNHKRKKKKSTDNK